MEARATTESVAARWVIGALSVVVFAAVSWVIGARPEATAGGRVGAGLLPAVNAALNAGAASFLIGGFLLVRRGNVAAHRACMGAAFVLSSVFLVTYLIHHAQVGSVPFQGEGWIRALYFGVLVPHIVLAGLIVPLALVTLLRGWTGRVQAHRRIARWTLPAWLYVSVSGVAVYFMLYHL